MTNIPASDGFCNRGRYMWNHEMYYESFTLNTPSFDTAYHHQVDTVGFVKCYFNPDWHVHVIIPNKGCTQLLYNAGRSSLGSGYGELNFTGAGLYPEKLVENVFKKLDEFQDFPQWLDDFSASAEHHFKTAMKEDYSLINLILEIIQVLEGNISKIKEWVDKLSKALAIFEKMYKKTGDYWLAWNFAIKPLIKDLKSIVSALNKARKRLKWLKKHNHRPVMVKYRSMKWEKTILQMDFPIEELKYVDINNPNAFDIFRGGLDGHVSWTVKNLQITCEPAAHALVQFDIDDAYLDIDYGLGVFWAAISGLYNPLKIVWEAIPYTWLIEWFTSKRAELLKELANLSPLKDAVIIQSMHSLKFTMDCELGYTDVLGPKADYSDYDPPDPVQQFHSLGPCRITFYKRIPELPKPESSIFRVPLEWYNLSILIALALQRWRKR